MALTTYVTKTQKEISQRKLEAYNRYNRIRQWGVQYPVKFCEQIMGIDLLDMQKYIVYNSWARDFALWLICRNGAKALSLDTRVPTPNGDSIVGNIKIGDYVYNELGEPIKVVNVSNIFLGNKCYEVTFDDGEKIIADADHLWSVQTRTNRITFNNNPETNRKRYGFEEFDDFGFKVLKTSDMLHDFRSSSKKEGWYEYKYRVPISLPIQYNKKKLTVPPYILGLWLGDGTSACGHITCSENDVENTKANIEHYGYNVKIKRYGEKAPRLCINPNDSDVCFTTLLRQLNLKNNKHIPDLYLNSSIDQRYELLQGLMDSDGTVKKNNGKCTFSQKSYDLIFQFSLLLNNLCIKHSGIKKTISKCKGKEFDAYLISFYVDKEHTCFRLKRKHDLLRDKLANRSKNKSIVFIKEVPSVPTKCIKVDSERGLFLCGERNTVTHNTTTLAIYSMLRSLLIPYHITYFLGNTGSQAKEVYKKIEKIAKKEIESFVGTTDVFWDELVRSGPSSDGFIHDPAGFKLSLFNGAEINTLNSDIINIKGRRASLVCFDEAGWFSDELFLQAEQFVNQDANFKLGGGVNVLLEPKGFPRQLLYASSASDVESEFYKKFKQFSERMMIGDKRYFACNFDIDFVMNATFNGDPYPPLISQDKVDQSMEVNREKALRELYNKFTSGNYEGQILTRREVMQHTQRRVPLLSNDNGKRIFGCAWDSARINDNSTIVWAEFILDPEKGWTMDVQNVVNLVDITTKNKTPMRYPEQVEKFKELLLLYNGNDHGKLDYENIKVIVGDAGSGGGMIGGIADYIVEDWFDKIGRKHKGIIDKTHKSSETAIYKFQDAIDILRLVDPKSNRNDVYDSIEKMVKLGVVTFPMDYDGKEYYIEIDDNGNEIVHEFTHEEQMSLIQIDLLKTEITTMCKYVSAGNIRYDLPPEKRNVMYDDRAFSLGLLCRYLRQLRSGHVFDIPKKESNYSKIVSMMSAPQSFRKHKIIGRR